MQTVRGGYSVGFKGPRFLEGQEARTTLIFFRRETVKDQLSLRYVLFGAGRNKSRKGDPKQID